MRIDWSLNVDPRRRSELVLQGGNLYVESVNHNGRQGKAKQPRLATDVDGSLRRKKEKEKESPSSDFLTRPAPLHRNRRSPVKVRLAGVLWAEKGKSRWPGLSQAGPGVCASDKVRRKSDGPDPRAHPPRSFSCARQPSDSLTSLDAMLSSALEERP